MEAVLDVEKTLYFLVSNYDRYIDYFNVCNGNTSRYVERHVLNDAHCLTKTPDRLKNLANNNVGVSTFVTAIVTAVPVSGISYYIGSGARGKLSQRSLCYNML